MQQLKVFRAARIEALADRLAATLQRPVDDPAAALLPTRIAVGNRGMERWLRRELASRLNIAANLAFPFPRQAVLQLLQAPEADDARWHRDTLAWRVLQALPSVASHPAMAPVVAWLARQTASGGPLSSSAGFAWPHFVGRQEWTLAVEIAGVLDKVAVYRPALLREWSTLPPRDAEDEDWQRVLWQAVEAQAQAEQPGVLHPSMQLLDVSAEAATGALHIFAVSNLPALWLHALQRAARTAEVTLYVLTPADGYWGDYRLRREPDRAFASDPRAREAAAGLQHPLLTSLGKVARDHIEQLTDVCDDSEPATAEAFDFPAQGVLGQLQRDLAAMVDLEQLVARRADTKLSADDRTVQFHACHGPARQVEALREALFDLLAADPSLQYRDIVVMTPDIASYAPLIETVFAEGASGPLKATAAAQPAANRWGEHGGPRIRTHIADLGLRQVNPLADVLMRMLELARGRLTAPALADLLACRPVMTRFGLDDAVVALVRTWLDEAGARLGADAADRAAAGLPEQYAYTFAFALDRMALGVAMADPGEGLFEGVAPYDEMEGDARRHFGNVAELCARVVKGVRALQAPRPLAAWVETSVALLGDLASVAPSASYLHAELIEGLQALVAEASCCDRPMELQSFAATLNERFERPRSGERARGSAVTVCALTPMRSVPFRVVCLLGMDDDAFPRNASARRFDLVAAQPKPGDPDPREDDRNLFLEALLSARGHLLVFYSGRDPKTDRPLAPAVPVGDLFDVIDATFCLPDDVARRHPATRPRALLTFHHRVQPFSPSGFVPPERLQPGPLPRRFDARMLRAAQRLAGPRQTPPGVFLPQEALADPARVDALDLHELANWLLSPINQLLAGRAGVHWCDNDDSLEDREALTVDSLRRWQLAEALLSAMMRPDPPDADALRADLAARAMLPPGTPGQATFDDSYQLVLQMRAQQPAIDRVVVVPLLVVVDGVALRGTALRIDDELMLVTPSDPSDPRWRLRMWLRLLAFTAMEGTPRSATLYGCNTVSGKKQPMKVRLQAPKHALALLAELVAVWRLARTRPLPLFAKSSPAWSHEFRKSGQVDAANNAAHRAWARSDDDYDEAGDPPDAAARPVAAVCGEVSPWTAGTIWGTEAADLARLVWLPIDQAGDSPATAPGGSE